MLKKTKLNKSALNFLFKAAKQLLNGHSVLKVFVTKGNNLASRSVVSSEGTQFGSSDRKGKNTCNLLMYETVHLFGFY